MYLEVNLITIPKRTNIVFGCTAPKGVFGTEEKGGRGDDSRGEGSWNVLIFSIF